MDLGESGSCLNRGRSRNQRQRTAGLLEVPDPQVFGARWSAGRQGMPPKGGCVLVAARCRRSGVETVSLATQTCAPWTKRAHARGLAHGEGRLSWSRRDRGQRGSRGGAPPGSRRRSKGRYADGVDSARGSATRLSAPLIVSQADVVRKSPASAWEWEGYARWRLVGVASRNDSTAARWTWPRLSRASRATPRSRGDRPPARALSRPPGGIDLGDGVGPRGEPPRAQPGCRFGNRRGCRPTRPLKPSSRPQVVKARPRDQALVAAVEDAVGALREEELVDPEGALQLHGRPVERCGFVAGSREPSPPSLETCRGRWRPGDAALGNALARMARHL
jgi:hypothetical protein